MRGANLQPTATLWPASGFGPGQSGSHHADAIRATLPGDRGGPVRQNIARMEGAVQPLGGAQQATGTISDGGQRASGAGGPDGGDLRAPCSGVGAHGPDLDLNVRPRGYAWWYVDALSDDGKEGLTLIAFIGSVFSPYYFKGRRRGDDDPRNYCSLERLSLRGAIVAGR